MKLFLSSYGIPEKYRNDFVALCDKSVNDLKIAFITTAANPYPEKQTKYMEKAKYLFGEWGCKVDFLKLENFQGQKAALSTLLSSYDVLWFAGGNCYFLRYWMKQSGFDDIIHSLLTKGIVYAGESAAAIVVGPTLKYFQKEDEPENGPELINEGLGLIGMVICPHFDSEKYKKEMAKIKQQLDNEDYKTLPLNDDEACIVST